MDDDDQYSSSSARSLTSSADELLAAQAGRPSSRLVSALRDHCWTLIAVIAGQPTRLLLLLLLLLLQVRPL